MLTKTILALCTLTAFAGCANTTLISEKSQTTQQLSGSPIQQVIQLHPILGQDVTKVELSQISDVGESPENSVVTLIESGLFDDSVDTIRTTYTFKSNQRVWSLVSKKEEFKCARGENTTIFQTKFCP